MRKKYIQPGQKLSLKLTANERKLVVENLMCFDEIYEQLIVGTPADEPLMMTLDELDDFSGYIAAEANHCDDKKKQKKLDAVFGKALKLLDTYTDEQTTRETLSMAEARDKISSAMNSLIAGTKPEPISFQLHELLEWRGPFDPEDFDAAQVTKTMRTACH